MKKRGVKAQIWVETVLYTLIGLSIIAALIAIMVPKVNQMSDKAVISQTTASLNAVNDQIRETIRSEGSQRQVPLKVGKGKYVIDSQNDIIYYVLENTNLLYSELDTPVKKGDITITTKAGAGKKYDITLSIDFSPSNITYQNSDAEKTLTSAPTEYNLLVQNLGNNQINIKLL